MLAVIYIAFIVMVAMGAYQSGRNPWWWCLFAMLASPFVAGIFLIFFIICGGRRPIA